MLLIIQKCPGLLFGNLILDRQIVVTAPPLILFCLQRTDKLGFLLCQRIASSTRIMDTPACQHLPNGILPVFFRKGAHTDIALLARMPESDVFPAGNSVAGLLHERIKALKVMRFIRQCCIHIQTETVAV